MKSPCKCFHTATRSLYAAAIGSPPPPSRSSSCMVVSLSGIQIPFSWPSGCLLSPAPCTAADGRLPASTSTWLLLRPRLRWWQNNCLFIMPAYYYYLFSNQFQIYYVLDAVEEKSKTKLIFFLFIHFVWREWCGVIKKILHCLIEMLSWGAAEGWRGKTKLLWISHFIWFQLNGNYITINKTK